MAIFRDGDCWKKKVPLSNGRYDLSNERRAMIKVRKDNSTLPPIDEGSKGKDRSTFILTGSVLLSSSVLFSFLFLLAIVLFIHCSKHEKKQVFFRHPQPCMEGTNLRSSTYKELEEAINGFRDGQGRGALLQQFTKGAPPHDDGINLISEKAGEDGERRRQGIWGKSESNWLDKTQEPSPTPRVLQ